MSSMVSNVNISLIGMPGAGKSTVGVLLAKAISWNFLDMDVVIQAAESANGPLNADGDTTDTLLVYFDFQAPTTPVILPDTGGLHAAVRGGRIVVTAHESLTNTDFTGDSDTQDYVLRVLSTTGSVVEPGLPCASYSVPTTQVGKLWAYLRDEATEGRTLNPDADMTDVVLGLWLR